MIDIWLDILFDSDEHAMALDVGWRYSSGSCTRDPCLFSFPWLSVLDWLVSLIVYSIDFRSVHGLILGVYIVRLILL